MDLLTYVLARKGGGSGSNGALTGLQNISINNDRQLVFEFTDRDPITTSTAIPAATKQDILVAITDNVAPIKTALDIPDALAETIGEMKEEISSIQEITANAVTGVLVTLGDGSAQEFEIKDNTLHLPLASGDVVGLVKGVSDSASDEEKENKISINEDGTMSVFTLNVNRLVQTEGDELIMGDTSD